MNKNVVHTRISSFNVFLVANKLHDVVMFAIYYDCHQGCYSGKLDVNKAYSGRVNQILEKKTTTILGLIRFRFQNGYSG